jgi:type IV pilus assembly protein PilQ
VSKQLYIIITLTVLFGIILPKQTQAQARIDSIESQLKRLSETTIPGLKSTISTSVSGVSIQEFLRGVASTNKLNINVDPTLSIKITNNFTNIPVLELMVFLCRQHQLSIDVFGTTILSVKKYTQEVITPRYITVAERISLDSSKRLLSFDLKNDTMERVARRITDITGKNIVLTQGVSDMSITSYAKNVSLENALEKIALVNSLRITKSEDQSYIIEKREAQQAGSTKNYAQGGNLSLKFDRDSLGVLSLVSFEAYNVPIADLIKDISKKMGVNYFLYAEPKGNITLSLSKLPYEEVVRYLFKGTDHTITKEGTIYLIGDRKIEGLRTTKVINLKYRSIEIIVENIPTDLKKDVEIKSFPELNSLILSGSAPAIQDIEKFIIEMDKLVPMVLIEVIILDVNKSSTITTGIKAGLNDTTKTGGTILSGVDIALNSRTLNDIFSSLNGNGVVNIGKVSPSFYVSLKALEDNKNIKIRSTPKLSTLNGHPATMKIGQTQYYQIQTQNVIGSQNPQTLITQQFNQVNADLNIKIEPFVSGDNHVTLKVDVELSNFTAITTSGPPPTSTRQFKSMIRIKNEEMVILGGLEEVEKSETGSGVPLLSRIPVIKWFFSSKSKTDRNSKLIVIVKPTIVN